MWLLFELRAKLDIRLTNNLFCLYNTSFITSVNTETENVFFRCIKTARTNLQLGNVQNLFKFYHKARLFYNYKYLKAMQQNALAYEALDSCFSHLKYCMSHDLKCKWNPFLLPFYILFFSASIMSATQPPPTSIHITFWASI